MCHASKHIVFGQIHVHLTVSPDSELLDFTCHVDGFGPDIVHVN